MFESSQYQLIDFGNGEKLERFGSVIVRRPAPAAGQVRPQTPEWPEAFIFEVADGGMANAKGHWTGDARLPDPWSIVHLQNRFLLKPTPFGHLGIFPEQADNWQWIHHNRNRLNGKKALNLFAYTGGTTMALARAGCQVVHIDAARNIVKWARDNAQASGLEATPVRWIDEDALKFVEREIRRGSHYDIVVADPPSFGHGPKNETWKIQRDFSTLLGLLGQLVREKCFACIVSCHTAEFGPHELNQMCNRLLKLSRGSGEAIEMKLCTTENRCLPAGSCFRWISNQKSVNE